MRFFQYISIHLLLLLCAAEARAQKYQAAVYTYGVENGLTHREVEVIFQDRDGFIWLGTRFGLNRFDGYTFKSWTLAQNGVNFNDISRIFQDDAGWLWLFNGDREFIFLHPETGEIRRLKEYLGNDIPFKTAPELWKYAAEISTADSAGRLHFFTRNPDLEYTYHSREGFRSKPLLTAWLPNGPLDGLNARFYNNVHHSTWQMHPDGWHISGPDGRLQITLRRTDYPQQLFDLRCIYTDRRGHVWMGSNFGLALIDIQPTHFQRYFSFSSAEDKPFNNSARGIWANETSIFVNFEGGGWVKMARHPVPEEGAWRRLYASNSQPYRYWGRPLLRDPDGSFWSGEDRALLHLDSTGRVLERFTFDPAFLAQEGTPDFWSIYREANGRLWLGTAKGLAYKDPNDPVVRNFEGLKRRTADLKITVLNILEDREKRVWLCTNHGLFEMNATRTGTIGYGRFETGAQWLPAEDFQYLYQDPAGIYWLATAGNGLLRWDRRAGKVERMTHVDGLSNDNIYVIYEDDSGQLWLSSDYGIMQLDKVSRQVRTYLPRDGVAQEEFNRIAHFRAEDGTIFLGGLNGVTAFQPNDFYPHDSVPRMSDPLCITSFQQFDAGQNQLVDRTAELLQHPVITIQPEDRFFQLEFALLSFENVGKIRYAWKIEGLDADWNYQQERSIRLSRLPFGTHRLRIKAQMVNGRWSAHELDIAIEVVRPFYLSTWFFVTIPFLLAISTYALYTARIRQLQRRQELLKESVDQATAQIQQDKAVIEQQAMELRQLDSVKSRFFVNISHELRTPLTLISGPAAYLAANHRVLSAAEREQSLQLMLSNSQKLLDLVEELLELSRLDARQVKLVKRPIDLEAFCRRVFARFETQARFKNIEYTLEYDLELALHQNLDAGRLETIVNNLLSNALHYTLPGSSVLWKVHREAGQLCFEVRDTGPGIHPDDLPHVFDRYFQSRRRETPYAGGSGIGLALAHELAVLMEGSLTVSSQWQVGSVFILRFPEEKVAGITVQTVADTPAVHENSAIPVFRKIPPAASILVVEDNPDMQAFLRIILSQVYQVVTAGNGEEAWNRLEHPAQDGGGIDLILTDIMMPVMDGFELVEKLKSDARYRQMPIVMLTARADMQDKIRALRIGVDDYLLKPFEAEELLARVGNLLVHAAQRRMFLQQQESATTPPDVPPAASLADQEWLESLEEIVRNHLGDARFSTEFVAGQVALSRRQLQRRLQQLVGLTPHAYIQEIRLHEARQLLENRVYTSVKEVAAALGYPNAEYFSRQFRDRFGKLPSRYFT